MRIKKRRIRNIENNLVGIVEEQKFYIGIRNNPDIKEKLLKLGFTKNLEEGETVLPSFNFGPITCFNATGKFIKLKDKPMETAYRTSEWKWKDWGGHWHSKLTDIPYKRYQRKFILPPGIELTICKEGIISTNKKFIYKKENYEIIKHAINLFLEIFGECEVFSEEHRPIFKENLKRLNWEILPKGKYPWTKLKKELNPIISRNRVGKQKIIEDRQKTISSFEPDFVAMGKSGFYGYVIFGFEQKKIYVLESVFYGNATYVFDKNWEYLSTLTKADILTGKMQKERIIHTSNWEEKINSLFNKSLFSQ